jgi:aryl-alcohol dehydrogenase-like predicted oxidoreductase
MNFGNRTAEVESIAITHAAIDAGINFIDTANAYSKGESERIVGNALVEGGRRDKVVLASKASNPLSNWPNDGGSSRYHLLRQCEASLKRLQTDRIDLYQLHWMDLSTPLEESMRALDDLVRQGKVLYTGCSKFAPAWLVEAIMLCDRHGWVKFVSEQPPYNLLDRSIENELIWACIRHGVGIIPWAPIGGGILSGKYKKQGAQPADGRFKELDYRLTPAAIDRAEALRPLAQAKGVTPAELSLAWVRQRPGITSPIIGPRTMEHLTSALRSLDIRFSAEELKQIDRIAPPGTAVSDYYDGNVFAMMRRECGI